MTAERKRAVEIIKQTGTHVKSNFRAVKMARWKEEHPNKDANTEGHIVKEFVCVKLW